LKTPICSFDAKTGILCPKCEARLRSGHLSKDDIDLSVKLTKIADKVPELNSVTLVKALKINEDVVLILTAGDTAPIIRDSSIIGEMENEIQAKIWLLENETSDRKMLEDLFYPTRILTVNTVWLPDGSKLTKLIVPDRHGERLPIDVEQVKKIAKAVRGIDLLVEFEK
jgi:transcription antitermination factor NusA-like protein